MIVRFNGWFYRPSTSDAPIPRKQQPLHGFFSYCLLPLTCCLLLISGCEVESHGDPGGLSIPPKEQVRVIARKIDDPANTVHWKWSVIGERNWTEARVTDTPELSVVLDKTSPLSDPMKRQGCNIWEVDLTTNRTGEGIAWKARIHGSDGMTAEKEGVISGVQNPNEAVHILQEKDTLTKLPAQLSLARIGEQAVVFRIAR